MPIREITVKSVPSFLEEVARVRDKWWAKGDTFDPWFRGQRSAAWGLSPSIYVRDVAEYEGDLRLEFKRRATPMLDERVAPNSDWEWYFLMQHYGVPTRLLDWTDSALVALHFASCPQKPHDHRVTEDAAVWMLDPWWLNLQSIRNRVVVETDWDYAGPYLPEFDSRVRKEFPLALDPPHIARRIAVQRGHFTVFGKRRDGLERLGRRPGGRLCKVVIPVKAIPRIRLDLDTAGISESTVFPDLRGLANELTRVWTAV